MQRENSHQKVPKKLVFGDLMCSSFLSCLIALFWLLGLSHSIELQTDFSILYTWVNGSDPILLGEMKKYKKTVSTVCGTVREAREGGEKEVEEASGMLVMYGVHSHTLICRSRLCVFVIEKNLNIV